MIIMIYQHFQSFKCLLLVQLTIKFESSGVCEERIVEIEPLLKLFNPQTQRKKVVGEVFSICREVRTPPRPSATEVAFVANLWPFHIVDSAADQEDKGSKCWISDLQIQIQTTRRIPRIVPFVNLAQCSWWKRSDCISNASRNQRFLLACASC